MTESDIIVEPTTGFEPVSRTLQKWSFTVKLRWHNGCFCLAEHPNCNFITYLQDDQKRIEDHHDYRIPRRYAGQLLYPSPTFLHHPDHSVLVR